MNVEAAVREGRCVLVFGGRVLQDAEVLGEVRRRHTIPAVTLSGDAHAPAHPVNVTALAPALQSGGVLVLIEAEAGDGAGLTVVANAVAAAATKPRLVIVARAFNPFALPSALRLLKFDHVRQKAKEFLFTLPVPEVAAPVVAAAEEPKKKGGGAPRAAFVGRSEELEAVAGWTSGPVVITGPSGVGKRWFVEKWLAGASRAPDFSVGWGSETDSLYARIAQLGVERGDRRLADALQKPEFRPAPAALAELAVDTLKPVETTLVVHHLEHVLRRDGSFHREGRLELLLRALLVGGYAARVVFVSTIRPRFYREGVGAGLQVLELGGLKGRELHEIFEAYRVEDFPRENFGEIHQRIHGHPLAARLFAVAVRDASDREELLEKKKFLAMDGLGDIEAIRRRLQKAVEGLGEDDRKALGLLAHFRLPFTASDAEVTGIKRETRLLLQARGLLDALPDEGKDRLYYVHPLVRGVLDERESSLYGLYEALGDQYVERADKATGSAQLALAQEGNRLLFAAHRVRNRRRMPYPDHDPSVESLRGLIRSKKPHLELAEQRVAEILKQDPGNTETWLLKAELLVAKKADFEHVTAALAEAEKHPTPEVFHVEATVQQGRNARGKAANALERGGVAFPENGRLRRRLAGVYLDQNRLEDAVRTLKEAMELEPMMPDTYGLLGEVYLLLGTSHLADAEAALQEARRLDPENTLHMARLGALYMETAGEDDARWLEAQKLLDAAVTADNRNFSAHLYLGRLLLERNGDLERADWLLKKAMKLDERAPMPLVDRARLLTKQQAWIEATTLLDRAIKMEPGCHPAFYAKGELLAAQGYIFPAAEEFRRALERSPKEAAVRPRYEKAIAVCTELIASGQAVELQKQAEAAGFAPPPPPADVQGQRRDPGSTTRRRKRGKGKGAAAAATTEGEAHEEAGAEEAAADAGEADATEAPVDGGGEAAPETAAEAAPEASADEAPETAAEAAPETSADEAPAEPGTEGA